MRALHCFERGSMMAFRFGQSSPMAPTGAVVHAWDAPLHCRFGGQASSPGILGVRAEHTCVGTLRKTRSRAGCPAHRRWQHDAYPWPGQCSTEFVEVSALFTNLTQKSLDSEIGCESHQWLLCMKAFPPKYYGGTERVVSYLAEEPHRQGHGVRLFASGDSVTSARLAAACRRSAH